MPVHEMTAAGREISLCPLDDIPLGMGRAFEIAGRQIAVFRTRSGSVHAVDNRCPHRSAPLADGILAGGVVVCPLHAFRFELQSGRCEQPDFCAISVYQARVHQGHVLLKLPGPVGDS